MRIVEGARDGYIRNIKIMNNGQMNIIIELFFDNRKVHLIMFKEEFIDFFSEQSKVFDKVGKSQNNIGEYL